jgi:hypothetical protein
MNSKTSQNKKDIQNLVQRGYALHCQFTRLGMELAAIKDQLKIKAAARPTERIPLSDTRNEGEQWIAKGPDCECRIVFPAPNIKTGFDPLEPDFKKIKQLAGEHFHSLFERVVSYQPVDKKTFCDDVSTLLVNSDAAQLLRLCTSPSEPEQSLSITRRRNAVAQS